jgi:hypothetical protein
MNRDLILTQPAQLPQFQAALLSTYERQENQARASLMEAIERRSTPLTLSWAKKVRVANAKSEAVRQGFFPVPRFPTEPMSQEWQVVGSKMPPEVFERFAEAVVASTFEQICLVLPENRQRDPLLIGIIGRGTTAEEHFLIAWWR